MPSHTDEIRALLAEGQQLARGENRHSLAYNEPDDGPDAPRWSPSRARAEAKGWDGAHRPTWADGDPDSAESPPRGRPTTTLLVSVSPKTLDTLRRGMRVRLSSSLLNRQIGGTVASAVPQLGTDYNPARKKVVNVRIQPDKNAIRDLVPGIRLDATIDLGSAPAGAKPLVFTSSGDGAAKPSG